MPAAGRSGIYIALGANLPSDHGDPVDTLEAALKALAAAGPNVLSRSSWWRSSPQPASNQPDFVNGVVEVATDLTPKSLLILLHDIESRFGRVRRERWEARCLDLDLLDYQGRRSTGAAPLLPHPRLQDRLFVLLPLQEIAPHWRHPGTGEGLPDLISKANPLEINKL